MSKWQEFPIRPQGRAWSGINTRSGKLDDGTGQLTDSSVNVVINRADNLAKRKGMVRGLDEIFSGPVCGLHKYTGNCGIEYLLVADQAGISVRQPFFIPKFESSDAYPSDSFQTDGPTNPNTWNNPGAYTQLGGSLIVSTATTADITWFKEASNFSYQLYGEWTHGLDSTAVFVIKAGATARIEARIVNDGGVLQARLVWTDVLGNEVVMGTVGLGAEIETGTVTLSYQRDEAQAIYTATMVIQATGGEAQQVQDYQSINALSDADLGQGTALRLEGTLASIELVQGDPI